jgi:hypothetical protein
LHLQRNDATGRWKDSKMEVNELLGRFEKDKNSACAIRE